MAVSAFPEASSTVLSAGFLARSSIASLHLLTCVFGYLSKRTTALYFAAADAVHAMVLAGCSLLTVTGSLRTST